MCRWLKLVRFAFPLSLFQGRNLVRARYGSHRFGVSHTALSLSGAPKFRFFSRDRLHPRGFEIAFRRPTAVTLEVIGPPVRRWPQPGLHQRHSPEANVNLA